MSDQEIQIANAHLNGTPYRVELALPPPGVFYDLAEVVRNAIEARLIDTESDSALVTHYRLDALREDLARFDRDGFVALIKAIARTSRECYGLGYRTGVRTGREQITSVVHELLGVDIIRQEIRDAIDRQLDNRREHGHVR